MERSEQVLEKNDPLALEEFFDQQMKSLEEEKSRVRSSMADALSLQEQCLEYELEMANLNSAEVLSHYMKAEAVMNEAEARLKNLITSIKENTEFSLALQIMSGQSENENTSLEGKSIGHVLLDSASSASLSQKDDTH